MASLVLQAALFFYSDFTPIWLRILQRGGKM